MFAKLLHLYQFVDQTMSMLFEKFPDEVRCGKGCTDCCNAVFDISYIEAANLLSHFRSLPPEVQDEILSGCNQAEAQWQKNFDSKTNPATARIRCPLLSDRGLCHCYTARPINCRTYGVPTVINGTAHVCGLSNFTRGNSYPTLDLAPLQRSLYEYSVEITGEKLGRQRWPVAVVLLHPEKLSGK